MEVHPCQKCGACCAYFRVNFYWREAEPTDTAHAVPQGLWVEASDTLRCMKGTEQKHNPKCVALKGRIGKFVACSIYTHRSSTCKKFEASFEYNTHQPRCDEARAKHGLRPLIKQDWFYQTNAQAPAPSQKKTQAPAEVPEHVRNSTRAQESAH